MARHHVLTGPGVRPVERSGRAVRRTALAGALAAVASLKGLAAQGDTLRVTLDDRLALERRAADDIWRPEERRVAGGTIIGPADPRARALWDGSGPIRSLPPQRPLPRPPALRIDLRTAVPATELSLQVVESTPHLRPMLGRRSDIGCDAFAPRLWLENAGWAPVEGATLTLRFRNGDAASAAQTLDLPGFGDRLEVDLTAMLAGLGLDAPALAACGPEGDGAGCAGALADGPLAPLVRASEIRWRGWTGSAAPVAYHLAGSGSLHYAWTNADGTRQGGTQPIGVTVMLGVSPPQTDEEALSIPALPAPAVPPSPPPAAAGRAPMAPDLLPVRLRDSGERYGLRLPLRGNPGTLSRTLLAELAVPRSSTHRLRVRAQLADGRALTSGQITAHLLIPRPPSPLAARDCSLPPAIAFPPDLADPPPHPDDLRPSPAGDSP